MGDSLVIVYRNACIQFFELRTSLDYYLQELSCCRNTEIHKKEKNCAPTTSYNRWSSRSRDHLRLWRCFCTSFLKYSDTGLVQSGGFFLTVNRSGVMAQSWRQFLSGSHSHMRTFPDPTRLNIALPFVFLRSLLSQYLYTSLNAYSPLSFWGQYCSLVWIIHADTPYRIVLEENMNSVRS